MVASRSKFLETDFGSEDLLNPRDYLRKASAETIRSLSAVVPTVLRPDSERREETKQFLGREDAGAKPSHCAGNVKSAACVALGRAKFPFEQGRNCAYRTKRFP